MGERGRGCGLIPGLASWLGKLCGPPPHLPTSRPGGDSRFLLPAALLGLPYTHSLLLTPADYSRAISTSLPPCLLPDPFLPEGGLSRSFKAHPLALVHP